MQRFFVMQKRNSMKINNVCCSPENRRNGKRLNMHAVSCCQPNPMARFLRHAANLKNLKHPANPAPHECTGISILSDVARKKKKREVPCTPAQVQTTSTFVLKRSRLPILRGRLPAFAPASTSVRRLDSLTTRSVR